MVGFGMAVGGGAEASAVTADFFGFAAVADAAFAGGRSEARKINGASTCACTSLGLVEGGAEVSDPAGAGSAPVPVPVADVD